MQLQMLVLPKKEPRAPCPGDASLNRRVLGRIKAVQSEGKALGGDSSHTGKEPRRVINGKKSRRRRRPVTSGNAEESDSRSHDHSSPLAINKQIRITRDKYCLNPNLTKLMRKSINEWSQGQDKTLKLNWKQQKEKANLEDKKKNLDTFNDTIRKNNLKHTQTSKELKHEPLHPTITQSSCAVQSGCMRQLDTYVKRMSKMVKSPTDNTDLLVTPLSVPQEKVPSNIRGLVFNESDRGKKLVAGQTTFINSLNESIEGKRSQTGPQKKGTGLEVFPRTAGTLIPLVQSPAGVESRNQVDRDPRNRSRHREKSVDDKEMKSTEYCRKKGKNRFRKEVKKQKVMSQADNEKIKDNLQKLNNKAKLAVRQKGLIKRLTRPRRSKSSNDLFSEIMVNKVMGRSDSVNSKANNEDNMYQEFKRLISRDKKGETFRDLGLKDKILRRTIKDKIVAPNRHLLGLRSAKMKTSKSSKIEKRLDSVPVKIKKIFPVSLQGHPAGQSRGFNEMSPSDRTNEKEKDIHEHIHQLSNKIYKNYENIPNMLLRNKQLQNQGILSQSNHLSQKGKRAATNILRRHDAHVNPSNNKLEEPEEDEDISEEEKELIEKEIFQPKHSDSVYDSSDQVKRTAPANLSKGIIGQHSDSAYPKSGHNHQVHEVDIDDKIAEAELNGLAGSPQSVKIKDTDSSDREESDRVPKTGDRSEIDQIVLRKQALDNKALASSNTGRNKSGRMKLNADQNNQLFQPDLANIKTPTGDPLSQEQYDKWMYLLQEFKKCENHGYVDGELKSMITNMYEKTQRGLTQLIASGPGGRQGPTTSSESRFHPPLPTSHSDDDSWRKKKPKLGIDVDRINEDYQKTKPDQAYPSGMMLRDTRSNSFQWLRAEFDQNLQELGKLLGSKKEDTLKKIQDAMELNERYSELFELRVSAINERFAAQKEQILEAQESEGESRNNKIDLIGQLDEWYQEEKKSMENERKKITKGWFTSIETIQKIKRDLEITNDTKKGSALKAGAKAKLEEGGNIYNFISRSLASPSSRKKDHRFSLGKDKMFGGKEPSPMASPHANSGFSYSKIISDPNLNSLKMKQADVLRKNEELVKSIDQIDNSRGIERTTPGDPFNIVQRPIEISEAKQNIIKEIDEGLEKKGRIREDNSKQQDRARLREKNRSDLGEDYERELNGDKNDDTPVGSPPNPSVNSSNLYNVSPTSLKRHSKPGSSNKPRSTLKSGDLVIEDKARPEDLIWIKDQGKPKSLEPTSLQVSGPSISYPESASIQGQGGLLGESAKSSYRYAQTGPLFVGGEYFGLQSPPASGVHLKNSGANIGLKNPTDSSSGDIRDLGLGTHTAGTNYSLESMFKKDSERGQKPAPSEFKETNGREGSRRADRPRLVHLEGEDYLNDLIEGIGFDSQVIKNDFEDTNKQSYGMDDFVSMSDSDKENSGRKAELRTELVAKLNLISDDILDMIFTDTIPDIIQILENENTEVEWEVGGRDNQQIYLQDGREQVVPANIPYNALNQVGRRGIRVNFNAVKEFISLLVNFIKGNLK